MTLCDEKIPSQWDLWEGRYCAGVYLLRKRKQGIGLLVRDIGMELCAFNWAIFGSRSIFMLWP